MDVLTHVIYVYHRPSTTRTGPTKHNNGVFLNDREKEDLFFCGTLLGDTKCYVNIMFWDQILKRVDVQAISGILLVV